MSQINSNIKDDFQVVLLLSCFVGHPVCTVEKPLINAFYSFCLFVIFWHRLSLKSEKGISILRDTLAERCQDDLDVWKCIQFETDIFSIISKHKDIILKYWIKFSPPPLLSTNICCMYLWLKIVITVVWKGIHRTISPLKIYYNFTNHFGKTQN